MAFLPDDDLQDRPLRRYALLIATSLALQAIVWALLVYVFWVMKLGYGFHDITDALYYSFLAERIHSGQMPYIDFSVEYPPLSLPFFLAPGTPATIAAYEMWFSIEMILVCSAAAAVTTAAAASLWRGLGRPLGTAVAFAAGVACIGAVAANRYDAAVALVIALALLAMSRHRWTSSGAALGLGFALKLTPVILLPLALILAARRRAALLTALAFAITALLPFAVFLPAGAHGLTEVFTYHLERPLQIESVPATPLLVLRSQHLMDATLIRGHGSQGIETSGSGAVAAATRLLSPLALIGGYALVWRRRDRLRADPRLVPGAALAVVLVFVVTTKVLSPQFLVWTLPLVALSTAAADLHHRAMGIVTLLALALTQVEFPALYWKVAAFETVPVLIVTARNTLLVVATIIGLIGLWRMPKHALDDEDRNPFPGGRKDDTGRASTASLSARS